MNKDLNDKSVTQCTAEELVQRLEDLRIRHAEWAATFNDSLKQLIINHDEGLPQMSKPNNLQDTKESQTGNSFSLWESARITRD